MEAVDVPKPEKKSKHRESLKERRRKRDKLRREKKCNEKVAKLNTTIKEIKKSNLVRNVSSHEIPGEAYLYLALGSTFAPVHHVKKHDHVYDGKIITRKLAWSAYHHKHDNVSDEKKCAFRVAFRVVYR